MIKYIGSKRKDAGLLRDVFESVSSNKTTAVDAFTGTTRVAQEMKRLDLKTSAIDISAYSYNFAKTYIETDARNIDEEELGSAILDLDNLAPVDGWFTKNYARDARFFKVENAMKVDAIRDYIEENKQSNFYDILITSLIEAADRVDSTVGVQAAYLKNWSARASKPLDMRIPNLIDGSGLAIREKAEDALSGMTGDILYLDPPFKMHSYAGNYHIWDSLVEWDKPETKGVARKPVKKRYPRSDFCSSRKGVAKAALDKILSESSFGVVVMSYMQNGILTENEIRDSFETAGKLSNVDVYGYEVTPYVGVKLGHFNKDSNFVGEVSNEKPKHFIVTGTVDKTDARLISNVIKEHVR